MEELKNYKSEEIDVRTTVVSVSVGDLLKQMPYVKYLYIYDESGNLNIQSVHDDIEEYVNIVVDDWSYSSGNLRISL